MITVLDNKGFPFLAALLLVLTFSMRTVMAVGNSSYVGPYTTVIFNEGQTELSPAAKSQLDEVVRQAHQTNAANESKIDEIQIATWSDNPMPKKGEQLSETDRDLASKRTKNIKEHLKKHVNVIRFNTYNMAERPSWLARFLDTDEVELKSEMYKKDTSPQAKQEFRIIKSNGDKSRSVVLVKLRER